MMKSRAEMNISQEVLDQIENSGSLGAFQGFFSKDSNAKNLFKLILENLVFCIKKKVLDQKDAEFLLI